MPQRYIAGFTSGVAACVFRAWNSWVAPERPRVCLVTGYHCNRSDCKRSEGNRLERPCRFESS